MVYREHIKVLSKIIFYLLEDGCKYVHICTYVYIYNVYVPGTPVADNLGLRCLNNGQLWATVVSCCGPLGVQVHMHIQLHTHTAELKD